VLNANIQNINIKWAGYEIVSVTFYQGEDYLVEKIIFRQEFFFRHALFEL